MKVMTTSSPFGSRTRTRVLLALELRGESYPREIARLLGVSLSVVQKAIRSLELDGLIAGRSVGRTRVYALNPRYFAAAELRSLTRRLSDLDDDLRRAVGALRTRPRRGGKTL
jgi:DNA-binding transcriptional ArsR family regulator